MKDQLCEYEKSSPSSECVAKPVHGSRASPRTGCLIASSSTCPFALSLSKGSERITTQSPTGGEGS